MYRLLQVEVVVEVYRLVTTMSFGAAAVASLWDDDREYGGLLDGEPWMSDANANSRETDEILVNIILAIFSYTTNQSITVE
jgi:hypothetical protein